MKKLYFENCFDLSEYMIDKAMDGFYTVATLFYEDASALIGELVTDRNVSVHSIRLEPCDYDGYNKEYYVTISRDLELFVEPAFSNGIYLETDADLMLIDGNASSDILKRIEISKCREIYISDYEDIEDFDCGECCCDCSCDCPCEELYYNKEYPSKTVEVSRDKNDVFVSVRFTSDFFC